MLAGLARRSLDPQPAQQCGLRPNVFVMRATPSLQVRAELGFPPLVIVVIGLIFSSRSAAKLSSTDLREEDAASVGGSGSQRSSSPWPA